MNNRFEDFPYSAEELSAYIFSIDTFVISLKNQEIIRYTTTPPTISNNGSTTTASATSTKP